MDDVKTRLLEMVRNHGNIRELSRRSGVGYYVIYDWARRRTRSIDLRNAEKLWKALAGCELGEEDGE